MISCKFSWVVLHLWFLSLLLFEAHGQGSGFSVKFTSAPNSTSRLNSATFSFDVLVDGQKVSVGENGAPCTGSNTTCPPCTGSNINCTCCCCPCSFSSNVTCKLDNGITTDCGGKEVSYTGLQDGNHKFEVCSVASPAVGCSTYSWLVDTVSPTAYITSPTSFTNAMNVSVNISLTEPCTGEDGKDGFKCSSENTCNLLVHGDGQVMPSSLVTLVPTRKYTLLVNLSSKLDGNVTLEVDNLFCTDTAGNKFIKAENSTFNISFDRRGVDINVIPGVPEKILSLDSGSVSLLATNNKEDLKLYLNFSKPVLNTSTEVLNSLKTSQGTLDPITGENLGGHRYGFKILNVHSSFATINVSLDSKSLITERGRPFPPIEPLTLLYDSRRPEVRLSTIFRTRQKAIPMWIDFSKPVLGFDLSNISISGGQLLRDSFEELYKSRMYSIKIQAYDDVVYVNVPENVVEDVFGNKNQAAVASLEVYDSDPILSRVTSIIVTSTFGITCLAHGMLAVSSASLVSTGQIASSTWMSDPAANLFLSLSHIQLIALSRWLPVNLPVAYYAYAKSLEWSIPYLNLPWEREHAPVVHVKVRADSGTINQTNFELCIAKKQNDANQKKISHIDKVSKSFKKSLPPRQSFAEYCESALVEDTEIIRSLYLDCLEVKAWQDFMRCMFWLATFGGSAILLHALLIIIVTIRWHKKQSEPKRQSGTKEPQTQRKPQIERDLREPRIQRALTEPQIQRDLREPRIQRAMTEPRVQRDMWEPRIQGDLREAQTQSEAQEQRGYGVLTFPRFEIFCIIVALPCICKASTGLIKGEKRAGDIVGGVLLGVVGLILLFFFIVLLVGITLGMLFLYDEDYEEQEEQKQKLLPRIAHLTLGPRLRGEWTWKNQSNELYLIMLGPLFEDLRGLRYHMLPRGNPHNHGAEEGGNPHNHDAKEAQDAEATGSNPHNHGDEEAQDAETTGGNPSKHGDRNIASNDDIEDVDAPRVNPRKNGDGIIASNDKTGDASAPGGNPCENGDDIIACDDKTEDNREPGAHLHKNGNPRSRHGDRANALGDASLIRKLLDILGLSFIQMLFGARGTTFMQKLFDILRTSFMQKLFGILRTYYILLESVRQVILGIMAGAFLGEDFVNNSFKLRVAVILLSITCFLLFFLLFLRPFVSKRGLLVEIISIVCEVGVLTLQVVNIHLESNVASVEEQSKVASGWQKSKLEEQQSKLEVQKYKLDVWMVLLPFIGYLATMINQGYALYEQIKNCDQADKKSFVRGLKKAYSGLLISFLPRKQRELWGTKTGEEGTRDTGSSAHKNRSSGTEDERGMKQPSEPTKSFSGPSKQGSGGPNDASSTTGNLSIPSPSKFGR